MTEALRLQNAARNSMEWFEHVKRYIRMDAGAVHLLAADAQPAREPREPAAARRRRISNGVERWFAAAHPSIPHPMRRRVAAADVHAVHAARHDASSIASSSRRWTCTAPIDGTPTDFHLVHLGTRALGGAGLVMTEMTCVSPEARITLGCTGMYTPSTRRRLAAHRRLRARGEPREDLPAARTLGRKGSTRLPWEGDDVPLDRGLGRDGAVGGPLRGRSSVCRGEMTRADMDRVRDEFVARRADGDRRRLRHARAALRARLPAVELHHAAQQPADRRVRRVAREPPALSRRGLPRDARGVARRAADVGAHLGDRLGRRAASRATTRWRSRGRSCDAGADIIHVSTGQTSIDAKPVYGRMYQTPFSDQIRNEARIPTIAVGNITEADQVNAIIAAGRADLCALARPHLVDPFWTLHAAAELGYTDQHWPRQYLTGRRQLERTLQRKAASRMNAFVDTSAAGAACGRHRRRPRHRRGDRRGARRARRAGHADGPHAVDARARRHNRCARSSRRARAVSPATCREPDDGGARLRRSGRARPAPCTSWSTTPDRPGRRGRSKRCRSTSGTG